MQITKTKKVYLDASELRMGVVCSRFNEEITGGLLFSALTRLKECRVKDDHIKVLRVPGSVEIPFVLQKLALTEKFNCLVALGCVIRGETPHFEYVCKMAQEGVLRVSLDNNIPIGFGVITVYNLEQARARLNLGAEAVSAALELALL